MAAPTPVSVTKTWTGPPVTLTLTPTINLDAATQIGDRTVITLAFGRSRPIGCAWPGPWSELYDINNTTGNQMEQSCAYLDHASTPPASVQVAAGPAGTTTVAMLAFAYRFAAGTFDPATPPEFVTAINTGNPPNFDPTWSGEEWLAIAGLSRDGSWGSPTYPLASGQQNDDIFGSFGTCYGTIVTDAVDLAQWVSTTTGTVTVVGIRGAAAPTVTGTLAAVLPAFTSSLTGTARAEATASVTMPALTSDLAGAGRSSSTIAGTLPSLTATFTGVGRTDAQLAGLLPALTSSLTGDATTEAVLSGLLPALTADLTGTVETAGGQLVAVLPPLTSSHTGRTMSTGALSASLPSLVATLTGTAGDLPDDLGAALERTFSIPADTRTLAVAPEARTLVIADGDD